MHRSIAIGIVFALALVASVSFAQDNAELEAAIDAVAAKYMEGWNAGDASACAATYTADGTAIDLFGQTFEGRAAIEESVAATLESYPGTTLDIVRTSLHKVSDNLIVTDGTWEVKGSTAEGVPTQGFYTIIATNTDGEWLISTGQSKVAPPMPSE
ncbi:MAG: hypothetical protein BMS9Abin37_1662 [Acidobacteriota bacterium]|nr:MAG: hypothetical protein BMS9Abin37_1662 [Acidobacteriota bacterium]